MTTLPSNYLKFFKELKKNALKEINSKAKYKNRKKTDELTKKVMNNEWVFKNTFDQTSNGKLKINTLFTYIKDLDVKTMKLKTPIAKKVKKTVKKITKKRSVKRRTNKR